MFGVDFFELAIIFGVALVVLGPKRLPGLVTKIGRMIGKARGMARQFREQLENEINIDELNRMTEMRAKAAGTDSPSGTPPPASQAESQTGTPAPPPEFTGEPLPPLVVDPGIDAAAPELHAAEAPTPLPTDDTFSHAHAAGDDPMPYVYENEFAPAPPPVYLDEHPVETAPIKPDEPHERQT